MSSLLPFKRLKKIANKHKLLISGYIRNVRSSENTSAKSISSVILLFYYRTIESAILTHDECEQLMQLFESQNKIKELGNYQVKLLYRQTRDKDNFKTMAHNKPNVFCLIRIKNNNVFGGYTSTGWYGNEAKFVIDEEAFIFSIRSSKGYKPAIFNAINPEHAVRTEPNFICLFGNNCSIWMKNEYNNGEREGGCYESHAFEKPSHKDYIAGTDVGYNNRFLATEVEAFQVGIDLD